MEPAPHLTPKARAVLRAASELFYAHGIHAVGVEAVAERAGVTKKTLYDRFGSKDGLVAAYLAERDGRWQRTLDARLAAVGHDAGERLDAVFATSRDWAATDGGNGCAMLNARAELGPEHPALPTVTGQKARMLALFQGIAAAAGRGDDGTAEALLLLHEGALVTDGLGVVDGTFERARRAARRLLGLAEGDAPGT